jgi:peptidoglycan hydrolase-like protein with peptidoglycan-binding domain
MRRRRLIVGGALVVAAASVAAAVLAAQGGGGHAAANSTATSTDTIERRTLESTETASGTLGFTSGLLTVMETTGGTVTRLPDEGATVRIGQPLYWADGTPVVLLRGRVPATRTLEEGVADGADVRQLEESLRKLGFDRGGQMTVDDHFDVRTRAIVERWQRSLGMSATGSVARGRIVFASGDVRVGTITATLGSSGGEVMKLSSTTPDVTVALDTSFQAVVAAGDHVSVDLPDGRSVDGRITSVGRVATTDENAASGATVEVTIALAHARDLERFDQTPVSVYVVKERRRNVLAAPVAALLARSGGGYAVEVVARDGTHRLVPVEVGLFASGYVEVSGVAEGTRVVVPLQ